MKRFRKALGIVALALVVSLSLAMPVNAWADESESYGIANNQVQSGFQGRVFLALDFRSIQLFEFI